MTTFLLDLLHDLREKRLWPVAAALLAATAAVPLLLFKPATHPSANGSSAPSARAESLPVVTIADSSGNVSKLDAFAKHNPFQPLGDAASNPAAAPATSGSSTTGSTGSSSKGSSSSSSGSGGAGAPGGSGSSGAGTSTSPGTHYYAFNVDVRFGKSGHEKTYKDVKQLGMLPDAKTPLVVFMGMKQDFKTAIFMIDNTKFTADGEGTCEPNPNNCSFVELKADDAHNEETLAGTDGTTYTLKLNAVKKVTLTADQVKTLNTSPTSPTKGAPKAKASGKDLPASSGGETGVSGSKQDSIPLFQLPTFAAIG